jgi:hypothetical protein
MTYLCYIDEAGCTTPLPSARTDIQPALVIVGLVVDATRVRALTLGFLDLKRRYFPKKFGNKHPLEASEAASSALDCARSRQDAGAP